MEVLSDIDINKKLFAYYTVAVLGKVKISLLYHIRKNQCQRN